MGRVVVLAPVPAEAIGAQLPGDHDVVAVARDEDPAAACEGADICVADWTSHHRVTGAVVDALAPTCRLVQVPATGVDSVDVAACQAAGIPVASAAGMNAVAVGEWCVWAAIGALRQLVREDRSLREGRWEQLGHARFELAHKVVGIVGMGDVGREAAARFRAFGVDLRYWSRTRRDPAFESELGLTWNAFNDLVRAADVLVVAVALTPDTDGLLGVEELAAMKPTAVVVNAARGRTVDEHALAAAIADGRLHGAAVDVYSEEPPPTDHPLLGLADVIVNPHLAGTTAESVARILERSVSNVRAVLEGREPQGRVV